MLSQHSSTFPPMALMTPRPVITHRICLSAMVLLLRVCYDVGCQRVDIFEVILADARHRHAVLLVDSGDDLQRVDGIQPDALIEQGVS